MKDSEPGDTSGSEAPTVYVVDDDPSVRKALSRLLRPGYKVETFPSGDLFLDAGIDDKPGCVVLDVNMPGSSGLELQKKMVAAGYHLPIVFLTGQGNIPSSVRAIKTGASDFLQKPVNEHELMAAIDQAIGEDRDSLADLKEIRAIERRLAALTTRELEVLRHVISGALNKQIAAKLGLSEKTIKAHRGSFMKKLSVRSVAELVRLAEKAGIQPAN